MSRMAAKLRAPTSISEVMASGRTEHSNRQQQRTWLSSPPALVLGNVQSSGEPPLIPTSRSSGGDGVFFQFPLCFLPTAEFNSGSLLWFRRCKAAARSGVKELVETKSYKPSIFGVGCNSVGTTPSASCRSGSRDLAAASGSSAYELNPGDSTNEQARAERKKKGKLISYLDKKLNVIADGEEIQVLVKTENMDPAAGAAGVKYNGVAIGFVAEEHSPDMRPGETSQGQEEKCKGYEEKMAISLFDYQHLHHSLYASKGKRL
nr:hypothetical protein Iba_chr12eCG4250 [Ipomoea batatas]